MPPSLDNSFSGDIEQDDDTLDIDDMPRVSKRVNLTKGLKEKADESKILCHSNLQKLFHILMGDIRLQGSLDGWEEKIKETNSSQFSPQKRELTALIFIKKAFLHKKLFRYRKCEESFKLARRLQPSLTLSLVISYQLILLYIATK